MRVIFAFLFVVQVKVALAQADPNLRDQQNALLQQGDLQLRGGSTQNALQFYTNAILLDDTYAIPYMKRARLNARIGRNTEALNDYNKAISLNPYSEYIYDERAKIKFLATDIQGSLEDIQQALQINPNNTEIKNHLIDEYIEISEYDSALKLLNDSTSSQNQQLKMALVMSFQNQNTTAENLLDSLLKLDSLNSIGYDIQGIINLNKGNYEQAVKDFTKSIELNPLFAIAYLNRAKAYRLLNNTSLAIKDLNMALELGEKKENIMFSRALIRKEMGDLDGALKDYNEAIALKGDYFEALFNRAFTYKLLGNYNKALSDAELILGAQPDKAESWNLKGNIQNMFGDYIWAIDSYSKAINIDGEYEKAYYNRGLSYLMNFQINEGCADLQKSKELGYQKSEEAIKAFCLD